MYRYAEEFLKKWCSQKDRKPLVIRGARQVGKSTVVRNFAKNNSYELIEINLEITELKSFQTKTFVIENLIQEIEIKFKTKITSKTILFFDEIQALPVAVERLRYFYEKMPQIKVVAAGSLLEIILNQSEISFPVGRVSFYHLGPMTFTEFLMAIGQKKQAELILKNKVPDYLHDDLLNELKKFYYIGGMPKAIFNYQQTNSLLVVRETQRDIIQTYISDFPKYNQRIKLERIENIFSRLSFHLGQKIIYQKVDIDYRSIEIKKIIHLLIDARLFTPAYHVDATHLPLKAGLDLDIFKLYHLDIGLLNYFLKTEWDDILNFDFKTNPKMIGLLTEQFISQHLAYSENGVEPPELFYWLRDKSIQKAELDFVIQKNKKIIPIEVKSSKSGHLKSLLYFCSEKKNKHAIRFSTEFFSDEKVKHKEHIFKLSSWPIYAVEGLKAD